MIKTYKYRVLEASWGVAVDLMAHLEKESINLSDRLAIRFSVKSHETQHRDDIELGISYFLRANPDKSQALSGRSLVIDDIEYTPTDFQREGVSCAVAGWLADEFGIEQNPLALRFDRSQNRYVFIDSGLPPSK